MILPNENGLGVACLQSRLAALGYYGGSVMGHNDAVTVDAIKRFQAATHPLQVDGLAGPRTLAALDIWSGITRQTTYAPGFAPTGPWPSPVLDVANFALTGEGIPYHAGRAACSKSDADMIAFQFGLDGADIETQRWAVYIASREGGCRFQTVNFNLQTADDSHCTFQLNVLSGTFAPRGELGRRGWTPDLVRGSMELCANAASDLWVYCGRGPWQPPYDCVRPWQGAIPFSLPSGFAPQGVTTSIIASAAQPTVFGAVVPALSRSGQAIAVAQRCSTGRIDDPLGQ